MSLGAASLPARERGLKREETIHLPGIQVSLPARERGLKRCSVYATHITCNVAPRAGAWIETKWHKNGN